MMLKKLFMRFQNRDFMEAVVAGCVLVSAADGHIDDSERQRMMGILQQIEELKCFNFPEIVTLFSSYAELLSFGFELGKGELLKRIGKIKNNPDASKTVVRICCSVGEVDGNFDNNEKSIVKQICYQLDLDPSDFEL